MESEKLEYTEDEIKDLIRWFDGRQLPRDLWMDKASHLLNTRETVEKTITLIENNKHMMSLMGFVYTLAKIRTKLIELESKGDKTDTKNT